MTARILGLGTALPAETIAQRDAADMAVARCCTTAAQARLVPALYRRTRIERRGSSLLEPSRDASPLDGFYPEPGGSPHGPGTAARMDRFAELAPALAVRACAAALADAGLDPARITHVITVTCTGFGAPGVDLALVRGLGLSPEVQRLQIGFMGCHAALNALHAADALARAHSGARVLVCCVELCSLHFQYGWDAEQIVANALFADGAAALVVGASDGEATPGTTIAGTASRLIDDSDAEMSWRIGDHGFRMTLSPRVPDLIASALRPWLDDWLAAHGLRIADVGAWAIHAGGPRIVTAAGACLELAPEALVVSRDVLRTCGNMSSATIMFILARLRSLGADTPTVLLSFGPGLAVESALLV